MQKYVKFTSLEYAILVGHKYITKTPFLEIGMQCSWFSGTRLYLSGTYVMPLGHSCLFTQVVSCKNKLSSIPGLCYSHGANVLLNPCSLKLLVLVCLCTQFFGFRKLHIFPWHCSFCYSLCPLNYLQFFMIHKITMYFVL